MPRKKEESLMNYPLLAAQWHLELNGSVTPDMVDAHSKEKYWWILSYDDPKSGKHFDFVWRASPWSRIHSKGAACPFLNGKAVWMGFNDLASNYPELVKQWHPTKNGELKPTEVTSTSDRKVWWHLPYDDPETGRHFEFEWEARIIYRVSGSGCPFLSGRAVWPGYNDLATRFPNIAEHWHPTKNGELKATDVTSNSDKKVWWRLPYDDPETGKHFDFEWESQINNRVNGCDCPFLSGRAVWSGYNDLATKFPDIAEQWHPTRNGKLKATDVTSNSNKKVWWCLPYDDPETGKHFDFEWEAQIKTRVNGCDCPFLSGRAVWPGYNDLATKFPDIAEQWHPSKNGELKATDVYSNSGMKVWWLLPYDDPETGKHFKFEWKAKIADRVRGNGCPYISGRAVWPGYNDLATKYPDLAMQWHPTQNGELKATEVSSNSHRKVWWLLPYDDPETGKHFDFEWEATIANRRYGNGCPYLSNQAVWPGYNDLETKDPELAKQWHPTKNGELKPTEITTKSPRKIWWYLPYDDPKTGKHFDFEWCISVGHRTRGHECPYLSGQAVWIGFNDLASNYPELAMQWHPTKNGKLSPDAFTSKSEKSVWWYLPYDDPETGKHFDFEWKEKICNRANGKGCPYLRGNKVWCGFNDLATCYPDVAVEWHFEKNRKMTPNSVHKHSSRKVWWNCQKCGNVWRTSVVSRTLMGSRCGRCGKTSDIKDNTC